MKHRSLKNPELVRVISCIIPLAEGFAKVSNRKLNGWRGDNCVGVRREPPQIESPEVKNRFINACKANRIATVQALEEGCIFYGSLSRSRKVGEFFFDHFYDKIV